MLTNDSLAGPYGPLDDLARAHRGVPGRGLGCDLERSYPQVHLQSYLLAFRDGVLAREPLRGFFADVRAQETKRDVIQTYEFGLSELLQSHGMTTEVGWPKEALGVSPAPDSVLGALVPDAGGRFPVREADRLRGHAASPTSATRSPW